MGEAWAKCRICGKRFEATYDPRFDRENPAGRKARWHVWEEHRDQIPQWIKTFEEYKLWDAGKLNEENVEEYRKRKS